MSEYATQILLLPILAILTLLAILVREVRRRLAPPDTRPRVILPMSSGVAIKPNTSAQIKARPQIHSFRPEKIIIGGTPGDWIVNDIKIHGVSQFVQSGDVPGEMFAATTFESFVRLDVVEVARDIEILVTYIGTPAEGAPFICGILGTAVDRSQSRPMVQRIARINRGAPASAVA
jgi:hypothetical protein